MKDLKITKLAENLLKHSVKLKESDVLYIDICG